MEWNQQREKKKVPWNEVFQDGIDFRLGVIEQLIERERERKRERERERDKQKKYQIV